MTQQFPVPEYRIVYRKSGAYLAAAIIMERSAIIDHELYWAPASSLDEARYLSAILNSSVLTMAVRPMQARGEHNPRHFDKYVFRLPIPQYDPDDASHARLVVLAERSENVAAQAMTTVLARSGDLELLVAEVGDELEGAAEGGDVAVQDATPGI